MCIDCNYKSAKSYIVQMFSIEQRYFTRIVKMLTRIQKIHIDTENTHKKTSLGKDKTKQQKLSHQENIAPTTEFGPLHCTGSQNIYSADI